MSFVLARKGALIASLAHHTIVFASAQPHTATTHRHHNQKRCHRHQPKGDLYVCLLIRQSTCLDQHRCVHHAAAAAAATAPHTRGAHTSTHTAVQAATHGHTDSLTRTTRQCEVCVSERSSCSHSGCRETARTACVTQTAGLGLFIFLFMIPLGVCGAVHFKRTCYATYSPLVSTNLTEIYTGTQRNDQILRPREICFFLFMAMVGRMGKSDCCLLH